MNRLRNVRGVDAVLVGANVGDGRGEVFVFVLSQQLFLTQVVDPQNRTNTGEQTALQLSESTRDVLARSLVHEFKLLASIFESVCFDEAQGAGSRSQLGPQSHSSEQVSVRASLVPDNVLSNVEGKACLVVIEL